jgi:hypothetical protein
MQTQIKILFFIAASRDWIFFQIIPDSCFNKAHASGKKIKSKASLSKASPIK